MAKARRCAPEKTSSGSAQVPPHWQGQGRGPSEPTPAAKPSYKAPPPSWAPRQPSQPPPQPKHPPRPTREEQAGGPRQPKPTPTSSRPTSFAQSCYEEDERWASGDYPLLLRGTCRMILQEPLVRRRGLPPAEKQLVVVMPRHRNRGLTWACNLCGRENHLLKGRCGGCQEVKTAQALPVAATHWRCPRCGEENRTARPACHGCFKPRTGKVELLGTAPSDDPRQSAHATSTSATSSWTTPATSSTGPTSSTAPEKGVANGQVCHQTSKAASGSRCGHWFWLFAGEHCGDAHQEDPKIRVARRPPGRARAYS